MNYNPQLTRGRILDCARREFLQFGYRGANMRRIAKAAEVTTGALYNHFANKALLFDALVENPAREMLERFRRIHEGVGASLPDLSCDQMQQAAYNGTDWMLDYIYAHFDVFQLIFCRSEGTRWAAYLEDLIQIEEQAYRVYCNNLLREGLPIADMFLHMNATSGFQYLVELVAHQVPYDQAVTVMDNAKRFGMAGWQKLLGLTP